MHRKRRDCDNGHVYNWIELDMFHTRITSISIIKKKSILENIRSKSSIINATFTGMTNEFLT